MQSSYTSMIWTKQLSGTDTTKRPVMSPKRHLRCRKIFRIIVEQLHPIGMTSCPDVSSVRVNRQVIDQSVQLQCLHRKNQNTEKNQKIKSIRNTGSKLQHNHQICLIWQNIDWGFFNKHFSPHFCFVFSPGMHHPHPCAMRNQIAALGFPPSAHPHLHLCGCFQCSDPHCLRQISTTAPQHTQGFLPAVGGRVEDLKPCNRVCRHLCKPTGGATQTRTLQMSMLKSQAFIKAVLSKIHICLFFTEQQHLTFTWVKLQLACFSMT